MDTYQRFPEFSLMIQENHDTATNLRRLRIGLMSTGLALGTTGAVCILAPLYFTTPVEWIVGGAMCLSGMTGAMHLLLGYLASLGFWGRKRAPKVPAAGSSSSSSSSTERGSVWMLVVMQLGLGAAMIGWPGEIGPYLFFLLLFAVAAEGGIILWASLHFHSLTTKIWMWITGALSVAVAGVSLYYWKSPEADHLIGSLIGAKLFLIGLIFFRIGWGASESDLRSAYVGLASFQDEPTVGSIYAVYYGPAFHCGISIGGGHVVDYLTDGIVRCIPWDEFLLGRRAMEWNYPDVEPGNPNEIRTFAQSIVGKHSPYDALKFNCENLAIYCRSVGKTTYSGFSQASVGVEFVRRKPLLGSMVQLLNRGASWFLYGAGGPFGKKVGFSLIRLSRALTDWVVARPLRESEASHAPATIYMPQFQDQQGPAS